MGSDRAPASGDSPRASLLVLPAAGHPVPDATTKDTQVPKHQGAGDTA